MIFENYCSDILDKNFLKKYSTKKVLWKNSLGYIVYKRTYSRLKENGNTEEWWETVARCINGLQSIGASYTKEEAEKLYDYVFNFKCCFSGRSLWQLGTHLVEKLRLGDSLLNCWGCKVSEIDDFKFILMESMFGGGVGCNIAKEYSQELPRVKRGVKCELKNTNDADFIVPDSKEGWVKLWELILKSYLITGESFTYSTVCIRPHGEPLKTFGGIAPGSKPLIDGTMELCKVLERREGKKLRTDDVADIICIGGEMIKSGGIRRTALILGGDVDDQAYVRLKRWDLGEIPNYRSNSNNSILCKNYDHLQNSFWEGYCGNGEAYGLINLKNAKRYGRLNEEKWGEFDLKEPDIIMCNPCGEAMLEDKEPCNLSELVLPNLESKEEMLDVAKLIYKGQKAIAAMNYYHEETNKVVHRNFKIGMSVTGVCQKIDVFKEWCDYTYKGLREFDKQWSKNRNYPQSIRLTVVQPSGTKSLMFGVTPGSHTGYSKYYIRRVRFDSKDKLLEKVKEAGYNVEPEIRFDGSHNHRLLVVSFPCCYPEGTVFTKDFSAVDQLNLLKDLQTVWADQAVSTTIYYKKEELSQIKDWLKCNYDNSIKSVSFLLHSEHGFAQAPYEEITKEQYEEMVTKIKSLDYFENGYSEELFNDIECTGGICPIR